MQRYQKASENQALSVSDKELLIKSADQESCGDFKKFIQKYKDHQLSSNNNQFQKMNQIVDKSIHSVNQLN